VAEDSVRTFIAIELPEAVTRGLARTILELRERVATPDIKWVSAGSIHVTLKFLGDVPAARISGITGVLADVCGSAVPLRLHVAALGAFPSARQPRVVWAGLAGDVEPLAALARAVDGALSRIGFAPESRGFTPHLTLGRVRQEAPTRVKAALGEAIETSSAPRSLSFEAIAASVMRSQLSPRGAVYTRLALLPFGVRPDAA
jgi:2'-5' RNA ligase